MVPAAPYLIAIGGHTPALQALEVVYLRCLCFAALPMLVMAAVNGFFSGRGQTWTVLAIEAAGTAVNVALALVLIFGRAGFPELGIAGAGWATVTGSWTSALACPGGSCSGGSTATNSERSAVGGSSGTCSAG